MRGEGHATLTQKNISTKVGVPGQGSFKQRNCLCRGRCFCSSRLPFLISLRVSPNSLSPGRVSPNLPTSPLPPPRPHQKQANTRRQDGSGKIAPPYSKAAASLIEGVLDQIHPLRLRQHALPVRETRLRSLQRPDQRAPREKWHLASLHRPQPPRKLCRPELPRHDGRSAEEAQLHNERRGAR